LDAFDEAHWPVNANREVDRDGDDHGRTDDHAQGRQLVNGYTEIVGILLKTQNG